MGNVKIVFTERYQKIDHNNINERCYALNSVLSELSLIASMSTDFATQIVLTGHCECTWTWNGSSKTNHSNIENQLADQRGEH